MFLFFFHHGHAFSNECSQVEYKSKRNDNLVITFVFDKAYPCGQFANADWWVSYEHDEGVTIVDILPKAENGRNGYAVNPKNKLSQTFDSRGKMYDKSTLADLPITITEPTSLIKTISSAEKEKCRPCLDFAAVLTVLKEPLQNSFTYFRPGYFGEYKPLFKADHDKWSNILNRTKLNVLSRHTPDVETLNQRFENVQLEAIEGYGADALHPKFNMPNYGARIATDNAEGILRLLMEDIRLSNKTHLQLLVNYLQMSVDFLSLANQGFNWKAAGGHNNGRKLPLVVGAVFIDEQVFMDAITKSIFSEDQQVYQSRVTGQVLYGAPCSDKRYWQTTVYKRGDRTCRDPYQLIDGGGHEIGEAYQFCCTAKPWKYTALAVRALKAEEFWSNENFFSYVDRWVKRGVISKPDTCAAYNNNPNGYGVTYGPDGNNGCIQGSGRWLSKHGIHINGGYYDSKFADDIWNKLELTE